MKVTSNYNVQTNASFGARIKVRDDVRNALNTALGGVESATCALRKIKKEFGNINLGDRCSIEIHIEPNMAPDYKLSADTLHINAMVLKNDSDDLITSADDKFKLNPTDAFERLKNMLKGLISKLEKQYKDAKALQANRDAYDDLAK